MVLEPQALETKACRMDGMTEEVVNALMCGLCLLLSIAGLAALVTPAALHGDAWQVVSFNVYGASLITLFLASTLYHAIQAPRAKRVFEVLDQSAIYLLIAGTYTPFTLVAIRSALGWVLFGVIWGLAVVGIVLTCCFSAEKLKLFSSLSYLLMGWLIVIGARPLLEKLPMAGIVWLVAGGVLYSAGVPLFLSKKMPFAHTLWHLFVLGGSLCHYVAIRFYLAPP